MREVAVLQAASEMILSSMDSETVLHQILLIVRNYFEISHCAVLLVDRAKSELFCSAQIGYDEKLVRARRLRIGKDGLSGYVAAKRVPTYLPDVSKDSRYLAFDARVRSQLCLPLIVREDCVGVLNLESDQLDFFTDEMIGILALFAGQAALALDNARLYTTERRRMRQIEFVNLIARSSTAASSTEQLLTTVSELLTDTFDGCDAAILVRNHHGGFDAHGIGPRPDEHRVQQSAHAGLLRDALDARSSVMAGGEDMLFPQAKSEMALPLVSMGETLGVILLSSAQPHAFSPDDRSIAQATADVCATAIRNVQLSDELRRVTNTDPLTGIFNQRYLHFCVSQELARAKRFGSDFAIVGVDLREFRNVNANLGFHRGDELLKRTAVKLRGALRSVDTVCRYEADTFVVVLPEITGTQAATVQEKLISAVKQAQQETLGRTPGAVTEVAEFPQDGESELHLLRTLIQRLKVHENGPGGKADAASGR
jgi:diguanylate cyclase (GGDEF)-like protein